MKRIGLLTLVLVMVVPAAAIGQVVGSAHDLSAALPTTQRVCVFCHTPHQPTGQTLDPLWNHTLSSTASYGTYDSTTFDAGTGGQALNTISDIGGATNVSNLCMSCHDGTIGLGSLFNDPNDAPGGGSEEVPTNAATTMGAVNANLGTDLTNDHPINFTYDAALVTADATTDGGGANGLQDPATVSAYLFGGTVQCASCHDPHKSVNVPFLRVANTNSDLCTTCHIK